MPEIAHVAAGGMPDRVKCLHVHLGHALAAGPRGESFRRRDAGRDRARGGPAALRAVRDEDAGLTVEIRRARTGDVRAIRAAGRHVHRRPAAAEQGDGHPLRGRCRSSGSRSTTSSGWSAAARCTSCGRTWPRSARSRSTRPAAAARSATGSSADCSTRPANSAWPGSSAHLRDPVLRLVRLHRDRRRAGPAGGLRATAALVRRGCRRIPRPGAGQAQHPGEHPNAAAPVRVAAIDCGTNSIRLLIADVDGDRLTDVTRADADRPARRGRRPHRTDQRGGLGADACGAHRVRGRDRRRWA